jgi:hypothetical protein
MTAAAATTTVINSNSTCTLMSNHLYKW